MIRSYLSDMALNNYKWKFELVSIAMSVLISLMVLLPIYANTRDYAFYFFNFCFVFLFLSFTRYIFLLRMTPFSHHQLTKLIFIFLAIPLIWLILDGVGQFQAHSDEIGLQSFVEHLPADKQVSIISYMKNQMLFFGSGSIVATIILALRLIVSIWRVKNTSKV